MAMADDRYPVGVVALPVLLLAFAVSPAQAGTIDYYRTVEGGSMYQSPGGTSVSLAGNDVALFAGGSTAPGAQCPFQAGPGSCTVVPGGSYRFLGDASSEFTFGISGSFILDGVETSFQCHAFGLCSGGFGVEGQLTVPDFGGSLPPTITVNVPAVTWGGGLSYFFADGVRRVAISGRGIGTGTFRFVKTSSGGYSFVDAQYILFAVPEPGATSMIGLGLLLVLASRFLRPRLAGLHSRLAPAFKSIVNER